MSRIMLASAYLVALAAPAFADGPVFDERVKDFGNVQRGPTLVHYFKLTNMSSAPMGITSLRVSCGCVTATCPVSSLKPGESTAIMAQMDSRRFTGSKTVIIYVGLSSNGRSEEASLTVNAYGRDDFAVTPDTLSAGVVKKGAGALAKVEISMMNDPNFRVTGVAAETPFVTATASAPRQGANNSVVVDLVAKVSGELPPGVWFTDIVVATSSPALPKIRVPLRVEVQDALSISPPSLVLGDVKAGSDTEKTIVLRADEPFKILKVEGAEKLAQVAAVASEAKAVHVLKINIHAGKDGDVTDVIRVKTDRPGADAELKIPVAARVVK